MAEDLSKTQTGGEGSTQQNAQPVATENQDVKVDNVPKVTPQPKEPTPSEEPVSVTSVVLSAAGSILVSVFLEDLLKLSTKLTISF